jgi:hypothetical protein
MAGKSHSRQKTAWAATKPLGTNPLILFQGVRTTVSRSITFFFWESDLLEKEAIRSNKERIAPKTFDMNSCVLSRTDVLMTTL